LIHYDQKSIKNIQKELIQQSSSKMSDLWIDLPECDDISSHEEARDLSGSFQCQISFAKVIDEIQTRKSITDYAYCTQHINTWFQFKRDLMIKRYCHQKMWDNIQYVMTTEYASHVLIQLQTITKTHYGIRPRSALFAELVAYPRSNLVEYNIKKLEAKLDANRQMMLKKIRQVMNGFVNFSMYETPMSRIYTLEKEIQQRNKINLKKLWFFEKHGCWRIINAWDYLGMSGNDLKYYLLQNVTFC
jgi:hypothetical protein